MGDNRMSDEKGAHWRVLEAVLADIRAEVHPAGGRLPSEAALAEVYGVKRATVTRAMERLRWIGLVVGKAGGTARVAYEPRRTLALRAVALADEARATPDPGDPSPHAADRG